MKKINFMDTSFRDGFQSCYGARVKTEDFLPILKAAVEAGNDNFEIGGGARFQSLYFYCQEDAFEMMDKSREIVGNTPHPGYIHCWHRQSHFIVKSEKLISKR